MIWISSKSFKLVWLNTLHDQLAHSRTYHLMPVDGKGDYHDVNQSFSKIVSALLEHVGYKNDHDVMEVVHRCPHPKGLVFPLTMKSKTPRRMVDTWTNTSFFPNGKKTKRVCSLISLLNNCAQVDLTCFVKYVEEIYSRVQFD